MDQIRTICRVRLGKRIGSLSDDERAKFLESLDKIWARAVTTGKELMLPLPKILTDSQSKAFYEKYQSAYPCLHVKLPYDPEDDVAAPYVLKGARPEVAILREQGVNSQLEMAAAFHRAGFRPSDVHMTDVISGRVRLDRDDFHAAR